MQFAVVELTELRAAWRNVNQKVLQSCCFSGVRESSHNHSRIFSPSLEASLLA